MQVTVEMLRKIMNLGYFVEEREGQFVVMRHPLTPSDPGDHRLVFAKFATFEEAVGTILAVIDPPLIKWSGVVRFNRGLGPEMHVLPCVVADTYERAMEIAKEMGRASLDENPELRKVPITAVRVTPINPPTTP